MLHRLTPTESIAIVSTVWIGVFVFVGRWTSLSQRDHVFRLLRIFSAGVVMAYVVLISSIKLKYISEKGEPTGWIGNCISEVLGGEADILFNAKLFAAGCLVLFVPPMLSFLLGSLLGCLPDKESENKSQHKDTTFRIWINDTEMKIIVPGFYQQVMRLFDPFNWLSFFLIKSLVVGAAVIHVLFVTGVYYHWTAQSSLDLLMVSLGVPAGLLTLSMILSPLLDAVPDALAKLRRQTVRSAGAAWFSGHPAQRYRGVRQTRN